MCTSSVSRMPPKTVLDDVCHARTPSNATATHAQPAENATRSSWKLLPWLIASTIALGKDIASARLMASGGSTCEELLSRLRRLLLWPLPHVTGQAVHGPQSPQPQYRFSWHCRGHTAVSAVSKSWHSLPPFLGYCSTARWRVIWPPHLVQEPQSSQSPITQSTTVSFPLH